MNYTITIDEEFRDLLPPLSPSAYEELEASCIAEGIRDPIRLWDSTIVDGHNRYRIAQEHHLPYETQRLSFESRDDVLCWIITNQVSRRDLTDVDRVKLLERRRGLLSKQAKARQAQGGGDKKSESARSGVVNLPHPIEESGKVREQLAAEAVDALKAVKPGIEAAIIAGNAPPKAAVIEAARIVEAQPEMAREILEGKKPEESVRTFNPTNDNIGWAAWSWNPVTGCLYGCPYCYARDIAMRFTGHFKPEFHPERMDAPGNTRPKSGPGGNRVFVGSMCDLFGDWVPNDWIHPVIRQAEKHPEWTFLFLTKNPKRYPDFNFPSNCWLGATADRQERVADIEESFARVRAGGTFVSCEPLLEAVRFTRPDLIDWFLIGALSEGAKKVQPDARWVADLIAQATVYGKPWWMKDNLTLVQQSPFDTAR